MIDNRLIIIHLYFISLCLAKIYLLFESKNGRIWQIYVFFQCIFISEDVHCAIVDPYLYDLGVYTIIWQLSIVTCGELQSLAPLIYSVYDELWLYLHKEVSQKSGLLLGPSWRLDPWLAFLVQWCYIDVE